MTQETTKATFRYKFSENFMGPLTEFARVHKFDDPKIFKENWQDWIKDNKELVNTESDRLLRLGYTGNVGTKMYKSARYYFKNKSTIKKAPKKRRQYIGLERSLLDSMDEHIETIGQNEKPAQAFNNFMDSEKYRMILKQEKSRLRSYNMDAEDIHTKLKKTYKNRHFNKTKKNKSKN